ncbi:MAG: CBS domain-containing protein [Ignavibacteriota bacterium]
MNTISEILKKKGTEVWSVTPGTKVIEVLRLMAEKNIGAVLVIDNEQLEGIFSERDYARKVALEGHSSRELEVGKIMSSKVLYATPEESVEDCMALMIKKRIRHLPVIENEKLKGLISIGDVVKSLLDENKYTIEQLEHYITGGR